MQLTRTHIGILRDIERNKISLDDAGSWVRDRLVELGTCEPPLLDLQGPSVILTPAGKAALAAHGAK